MSNAKSKQAKPKTGLARCMELASDRKGLVFLAAVLSSLAAIASFIPYIAVYFMIRSIIGVFPNLDQLDMGMVMNYGWLALAGIVANILLYFLAIFSSHMAAFGTLYELKVLFADHIVMNLSGRCRTGIRRSSVKTAAPFPAVSASVFPSPEHC